MSYEFIPTNLTGALVLEVRTRHKLSRARLSELAGFTGKSTARLSNIEMKDSWKPGDREALAHALNSLLDGQFDPVYRDVITSITVKPEVCRISVINDDDDDDDLDDVGSADYLATVVDEVRSPVPTTPVEPSVTTVESDADDGVYRVSNSEIQTWKRCRRKWWFAWYSELRLRTEEFTGVRSVGDRVHRALSRWYVPDGERRVDPRDALERVIIEDWTRVAQVATERGYAEERFSELAREFGESNNLERAMIEGYVQWLEETGADAELRVIASETPLSADLETVVNGEARPVRVIGLLDARVHRVTDDRRLFIDHKPQPLSAPILTPTGWVKLGELRVGSVVSGAHGEPIRVTHIFDRGVDDVYEVTLNDGTSVHATSDHPWMAKDTTYGAWKIVETQALKVNRHRLRAFEPFVEGPNVSLPLEPYFLGAWLTNGDRRGRSISDGERQTLVATGLDVVTTSQRPQHKHTLYEVRLPTSVRVTLDELNLLGLYSRERFIPDVYVHVASYRQRLALLRGLMDGAGCLTTYSHSSVYVSSSRRLVSDVAALVRSLGGWTKTRQSRKRSHVGKVNADYDTHTVMHSLSIRSTFNPFLHVHHAQRWLTHRDEVQGRGGTTSVDKIVKNVQHVGHEHVRCVELDSVEKLYVTSDYTLSHNTVGDLSSPAVTLPQNEQMLHYDLLEWLNTPEGETRCDGALYNMLRRVKRTVKARPPFYDRFEVHHNVIELESYKTRLLATTRDVLTATDALTRGEPHHEVVYPTPKSDCRWDCDFFAVCNLFDDGSAGVHDMVNMLYRRADPRDRYEHTERRNQS